MTGNDVLRSLRYLLESDDATRARIIALGGGKATRPEVTAFMLHEEEPGYVNCPHHVRAAFLNGLIIHRDAGLGTSVCEYPCRLGHDEDCPSGETCKDTSTTSGSFNNRCLHDGTNDQPPPLGFCH